MFYLPSRSWLHPLAPFLFQMQSEAAAHSQTRKAAAGEQGKLSGCSAFMCMQRLSWSEMKCHLYLPEFLPVPSGKEIPFV